MVLVLFFVSMSPLLSVSAAKHLNYSEIYYYFQSNQVTSFRLDRNNLRLELWLKEGERPLPEATTELDSEEASGLLSALGSGEEDALPANGGTVYVSYKVPYGIDFETGRI